MNTLLVNPGRRNYFVKYFLDLSKKFNLKIFLIDPNKNIPSFKVSKKTKNFICPDLKNKKIFKVFLRKFVKKNKIKVIFPFSEYEQEVLSLEKNYYKKNGVDVIISNSNIIRICSNKVNTYKFLNRHKISSPKLFNFKKVKKNLPNVIKKKNGSGSVSQIVLKDKNIIPVKEDKNFIYQKFHNAQEYGVDILNDLNGNFLHFTVKKKIAMRAGDTDRAIIVNPKRFKNLAKTISKNLRHVGNLDVDFLLIKEKIYVLDLNPRFGGGYPFTHEYGYNYIEKIFNLLINKKLNKFKKFSDKKIIFSKGITIHKH